MERQQVLPAKIEQMRPLRVLTSLLLAMAEPIATLSGSSITAGQQKTSRRADSQIVGLHRSVPCGESHILLKVVYDQGWIDATSSEPPSMLPVCLFLSGADCPHESYMWLASHLAREGFCVVLSSCVVPYGPSTFLLSVPLDLSMLGSLQDYKKGPSSEGIAAILQEVRTLAEQEDGPLHGKLDLTRIVLSGHSSGGRTALDFVAFDNPFNISAVFTYGASFVNSGAAFYAARGSMFACDAVNPPPLLMLGGSEDGVAAKISSLSGDNATESLRRTMDEAFTHANGDADLIIFNGCNHMVVCTPVDPSCKAVASDRPLTCDGAQSPNGDRWRHWRLFAQSRSAAERPIGWDDQTKRVVVPSQGTSILTAYRGIVSSRR